MVKHCETFLTCHHAGCECPDCGHVLEIDYPGPVFAPCVAKKKAAPPPALKRRARAKRPPAPHRSNKRPPLLKQAANFGVALVKWSVAGFPSRTAEEVNELVVICQACDEFDAEREQCLKCGCPTRGPEKWRNKLLMKTERCPLGKW